MGRDAVCIFVCLYVEPVLRPKDYVRSLIKMGSVLCLCTPVWPSVPKMYGIHAIRGHPFLRMYLVGETRMPGESYRRRLRSLLLYLCVVFRALVNPLVC